MSYTINDIQSLTFREGVRLRIGAYLGSDDNEGTYQALKEIINNSTDEILAGYGNSIGIQVNEEKNIITVIDEGRGVPFGIKPDGTNVLVDIYTKAHTGGKFDHTVYKNSSGLNGLGASCVCLSSKFFEVTSIREGKKAIAKFERGELVSYEEKDKTEPEETTGTIVTFSPDPEVFKTGEIGFKYERICDEIKNLSYLYKGVSFNVSNINEYQTYCAKNGIQDMVSDLNPNPLHPSIILGAAADETDKVEIAFQWGGGQETSRVFVNGLLVPEGGAPITGAKTAITRTFNSLSGKDINGDYIRRGLVYVIKCTVASPSFANQTKSKINNENLRKLTGTAFSEALKQMKSKYGKEFEIISDVMTKISKAEAAADKARKQILANEKEQVKIQKSKILNVDKLCDARKLGENSTLLLCEGLSAGGSMKIGRDADHYGILMLRGKCKNLLNCTIEEGLQNEEVKLFQQALGVVYGRETNSLRYGKIAIASDSDFDGSHIGLLIMAMAQVICPSILTENKLYWLKAPIYKVETKSKSYFYYTEEEFADHPVGIITRFKGLGQMQDTDLKESMFNPEWQRLEPISFNESGLQLLIDLMGEDVEKRKEFVYNYIDFNKFTVE